MPIRGNIATSTYRYKRPPPRKRKPNPAALAMPAIVTAKKPKPRAKASAPKPAQQPAARSAIVTIPRKRGGRFGDVPDMTPEEHKRRRQHGG